MAANKNLLWRNQGKFVFFWKTLLKLASFLIIVASLQLFWNNCDICCKFATYLINFLPIWGELAFCKICLENFHQICTFFFKKNALLCQICQFFEKIVFFFKNLRRIYIFFINICGEFIFCVILKDKKICFCISTKIPPKSIFQFASSLQKK